jgi:hypothetical protein
VVLRELAKEVHFYALSLLPLPQLLTFLLKLFDLIEVTYMQTSTVEGHPWSINEQFLEILGAPCSTHVLQIDDVAGTRTLTQIGGWKMNILQHCIVSNETMQSTLRNTCNIVYFEAALHPCIRG